MVTDPPHYAGDGKTTCMVAMASMMSPMRALLPNESAYWWGCAFKYLWRWALKGGRVDLYKCIQSIKYLLESLDKEECGL